MASPTSEQGCFSDVRKVGYLRKPKSMHKRFFVLRVESAAGPSRLEYYENEKKWRHKSGAPKRSIPLESCFNINKRADSKNKFLVALYTKDEYFAIAADSETEQDAWYQALVDLHNRGKIHDTPAGNGIEEDNYSEASPGPAFKEVWQVILKPKGLGHTKNLIGIYRLCLTNKTISFVKLNSDAAAVVLQLMNIRRCGHSENFFFIEVGRSAVTGPGEFWMQVDDSVVAQNMHETILEAMKAMSEEFRPRSKSQSSSSHCSNPISVPVRRHHHNNPPPSQVGMGRRSRAESVTATSPAGAGKHSHSFRVRASSDGEGSMSRPASVDGSSPSSPCIGGSRTQSYRQRAGGSARLHPPLNHSRSIPMASSSRCSPSAVSPVSLSSSSTSGHGSTSDGLFPRRSSASISGSPSDGGFVSSDEYGSSPGDFRGGGFRSATPDFLGHTPPAREEEPLVSDYITMTQTPRRPDDPEPEKSFRKRTHSSGAASPPVTCHHQKTPSQSSATSLEEYAVMLPAYPCTRTTPSAPATPSPSPSLTSATCRHSAFVTPHSYPEEGLEVVGGGPSAKDDGYMPMSPGVAPTSVISMTRVTTGTVSGDDYMPMSPKSVSAPQQIVNPSPRHRLHENGDVDPSGYMMMWPSSSCSPDGPGRLLNGGVSAGRVTAPLAPPSGDYMNMSPASGSATSTPPDCYFSTGTGGYFSLPRSFKHAHRKQPDHASSSSSPRLSLGAGRRAYTDSSSSSASSDSLGGGGGGGGVGGGGSHGNSQHPTRQQPPLGRSKRLSETGESRLARPTRLALEGGRASTLPRSRQTPYQPEPRSPGEYVNIQFSDQSFTSSLVALFPAAERPASSDGSAKLFPSSDRVAERFPVSKKPVELSAPPPSSTDYMNMQLGSSNGLSVTEVATSDIHDLSDYAVVTPGPVPPASAALPCDSICQRDYLSMQVFSGSPVMLLNPSSLPDDPPTGPSTHSISPNGSEMPGIGGPLIGPLSGLSAFTRVSSVTPPSRSQGITKVIRADPQGRRRHSSETFASTTTKSPVGTATTPTCPATDEVKRHSSASFENVWLKPGGEPISMTTSPAAAAASAAGTRRSGGETSPMAALLTRNQNGLNYIDLDLAHGREQLPADWSTFSTKAGDVGVGGSSEELNAYASISFSSPQENREE
ncbi:insulin receptor substrate 1-B isoform X2 [Clupea harengus]|uniref:Insulin receptor substrate 1-B isoform X2 n=1 Tax=Clupea harengus TaxID=7950 RepID=A0A6P3WA82_CLUHA|nr:insulin receptor substrate 1-B isoform X2 [Clupea harengus]